MARALFLCLTIVAGFPLGSAAAPPISEDAPVTAAVAAIARTAGLEPAQDRARFLAELIRLLYTQPSDMTAALAALPRNDRVAEVTGSPDPRVPVPLSADVWGRAIFKRPIASRQLVAAIVSDRRAALLCYPLAALDDETLGFLSQHPAVLARLYERAAPEFAAFGASLRIRSDRVVPPGGDAAVPLWEGVVGERVDTPDRFLRALFELHAGRVAYLYDTIAQLDAPNAAFALGLWMDDQGVRLARFAALVDVSIRSYGEWRLDVLPFSKPLHDLAMLLMRIRVGPTGAPVPPAERSFWADVFASDDLEAGSVSSGAGSARLDEPLDAAWLADATAGSDLYWRGDRLDQFAFGQRVFSDVALADWPDAIVAIRAFPRYRMLALAFERSGIKAPAIYATAARRAREVSTGRANRAFWTLAQLQSAIAQILRMTKAGTIDLALAEALIESVGRVPLDDAGRYGGAMAEWVERELLPRLPRGESAESRVMAALAGPADPAAPRVAWEGQEYRLDLASGERHRIEMVRAKQVGYSLDLALDLHGVARLLASEERTAEDIRTAMARLSRLADLHGSRFSFQPDVRAPGVDEPRPAPERVARAVEELSRIARGRDFRRAARVASALDELVDVVLGDALLSLTYAAELGDPEGPAMLARNVALRHDFGFSRRDAEIRTRTMWAVPRRDFLPGVPWHVTGSLVGLDIALAPLSLRRIELDRLAEAPRLPSIEREAFAVSVTLIDPRQLHDRDRDAIVQGVARGRRRVTALASGDEPLEAVAEAIALDGWRRRAIQWMQTNDRAGIPAMFSLVELVVLGGGAEGVSLDAWGTTALASVGCACTRLMSPRSWRLLSGRPQLGLMASGIADLNLHVALMLGELRLPAALARSVLSAAVLEFVEEVGPRDPNDWWSVARAAQAVPRERIEDYVAAAAAADGPLVPAETLAIDLDREP